MPEHSPQNPITRNHYLELPVGFFQSAEPAAPTAPALIELNQNLLADLGMAAEWFSSNEGLAALSGQGGYVLPPVAMAYAGHQFGHWAPLLGDGRAHMLGQLSTANGMLDVQLKGSGRTPYSRGGDGRATLGAVLREYIVSEAMAGLGISSTRSLAVIATGDAMMREQPMPGAVLVRTAQSHIRVGSFQYAAANFGQEGVQALADFCLKHYFPELEATPSKYLALFSEIVERQAELIAQWMLVGFIHGVMNTDNMSIIGETIDYGPCAFMDEFNAAKVFSSIDQQGRYAWNKQPSMAYWNLAQLASSLMPLIHSDADEAELLIQASLDGFATTFNQALNTGMRRKFGIADTQTDDAVAAFIESALSLLAQHGVDYSLFFDGLTRCAENNQEAAVLGLFADESVAADWLASWRVVKAADAGSAAIMRRANPAIIARNHRVEQAIDAAVENNDFGLFRRLCAALKNPYEVSGDNADLQRPPRPTERVTQTFCGT